MNINLSRKGISELEFSDGVVTAQEAIALQVIQTMNAAHNKISLIRGVRMFISLVTLDLSYNRLTSPVGSWLRELPPTLKSLNVSHNEIATFGTGSMCKGFVALLQECVPHLQLLDVSHNLLHVSSRWDTDSDNDSVADEDHNHMPRHPLRELNLSDNTGVFSLQPILRGLSHLETLRCDGNHIETLEELAPVASLCPSLQVLSLEGNEIHEKLTASHFLWNLIGGDELTQEGGAEELSRDVGQLAGQFFAALVSEVVPQVNSVNGVKVVESWELVGHLLDGLKEPAATATTDAAASTTKDEKIASATTTTSHAKKSSAEVAANVTTNDASVQIHMDSSGSEKSAGSDDDDDEYGRGNHNTRSEESYGDANAAGRHLSFDLSKQFSNVMRSVPLAESDEEGGVAAQRPIEYSSLALDRLHQKAAELQQFIADSQSRCRDLEDFAAQATTDIRSQRRFISQQLAEMAALRLERTSQRDALCKMERVSRKRTLELTHAEVANSRVEEKKKAIPMEARRKQQETLQQRVKREKLLQQSLQGPPESQAGRPTRTSIMVLEETQRKLAALKQSSPTALLGTRFAYDEYGNPSFIGSNVDAEMFPESAHQYQSHNQPNNGEEGRGPEEVGAGAEQSPRRTSKRLSFAPPLPPVTQLDSDDAQSPAPAPVLTQPPPESLRQTVERRRSTILAAQEAALAARRQSQRLSVSASSDEPSRSPQRTFGQTLKPSLSSTVLNAAGGGGGRSMSLTTGKPMNKANAHGSHRRATQPDFASFVASSTNVTGLTHPQDSSLEVDAYEPIATAAANVSSESQFTAYSFPADDVSAVMPVSAAGHSEHGSMIQPVLEEDALDYHPLSPDGSYEGEAGKPVADVVLQSPTKRVSEYAETGGHGLRRPSKPSEAILALASNEARAHTSQKEWETKEWESEEKRRAGQVEAHTEPHHSVPSGRSPSFEQGGLGMTSVGRAAVVPLPHRYNLSLGVPISKQKPLFRQS